MTDLQLRKELCEELDWSLIEDDNGYFYMNLKQKREIVRRFKAGESIEDIAIDVLLYGATSDQIKRVQQVLRDFLNGKFTLEPAESIDKLILDAKRRRKSE